MAKTEDHIHRLLKESGYLDSPAHRFFWKNASPTLRNHIRQVWVLALSCVVPFSILLAAITLLPGWDRLVLFAFYAVLLSGCFFLLDFFTGLLVRFKILERFWNENRLLNWLPLPICAALLFFLGRFLAPTLAVKPLEMRLFLWIALALSAWLVAGNIRLLFVSRLYWHGMKPPRFHPHPALMAMALIAIGAFQFRQTMATSSLPAGAPVPAAPVMMLAFDIPETMFERYISALPPWSRQELAIAEGDITNFWTSFGTGTPASLHRASLVAFKTPWFSSYLNQLDPTQRPPLTLSRWLGQTVPLAEGGRYRKYFWEILDAYQRRAYALNFWHSFPASSQNGGVLTERWTPSSDSWPYVTGMAIVEPESSNSLPLSGPDPLHPTIQRENQSWAQLRILAERGDLDVCIAYFPLGDLLDDPGPTNDQQERLLAFRIENVTALLQRLPRETKIGIFLASGKPGSAGSPIRFCVLSNWLAELAQPLQSHMEIAPTVLNYFGLPADRLMAPSRLKNNPEIISQRADYGEPRRLASPLQPDSQYYEELKSLGYVH